jgi:hypothetical protein
LPVGLSQTASGSAGILPAFTRGVDSAAPDLQHLALQLISRAGAHGVPPHDLLETFRIPQVPLGSHNIRSRLVSSAIAIAVGPPVL